MVEPIYGGPVIVAFDFSNGIVLRQGMVYALSVHAAAVIDILPAAAVHIKLIRQARSNILCMNMRGPVDVQASHHLIKRIAAKVCHQLLCRLLGPPVVHRNPICFFIL